MGLNGTKWGVPSGVMDFQNRTNLIEEGPPRSARSSRSQSLRTPHPAVE
jgi:hypothetical protein